MDKSSEDLCFQRRCSQYNDAFPPAPTTFTSHPLSFWEITGEPRQARLSRQQVLLMVFSLGLRQHINRRFQRPAPLQKLTEIPFRISSHGTTTKIFAFKIRSPSKAGQGKALAAQPQDRRFPLTGSRKQEW